MNLQPGSVDEPGSRATPLFEAQHAPRYERQQLIRDYEAKHECCLIVVSSPIYTNSTVFVEELVHDCAPEQNLHLLLTSPGGDGESAVRIVRSIQQRCNELTILLADQAKSAATLLTLGSHKILMGPFGDLGPIDPQLLLPSRDGQTQFVSAKDIIASVEDATRRIQDAPESYTLWASLFSNITGIIVQQARTALARSSDQLREALAANPDRDISDIDRLVEQLKGPLIDDPKSHGAVFGFDDAIKAGLPAEKLDASGDHWHDIWRLWSRYAVMGAVDIYEGRKASQMFPTVAGAAT